MDDTKLLKTGDPCPCCGQPIKTRDPELLRLLTYIRDSRCNEAFTHEYMIKPGAGNEISQSEELRHMVGEAD